MTQDDGKRNSNVVPFPKPKAKTKRRQRHTPFLPFYGSDWIGGTRGFTLEQRGFYFELLWAMWETKAPLPDDVKWLSEAARCSKQAARRLRGFLINKRKLYPRDGLLINPRMVADIATWEEAHEHESSEKVAENSQKSLDFFPETPMKSTTGVSHHNQSIKKEDKREDSPSDATLSIDGARLFAESAIERLSKLYGREITLSVANRIARRQAKPKAKRLKDPDGYLATSVREEAATATKVTPEQLAAMVSRDNTERAAAQAQAVGAFNAPSAELRERWRRYGRPQQLIDRVAAELAKGSYRSQKAADDAAERAMANLRTRSTPR